jgi:hypothetical protein
MFPNQKVIAWRIALSNNPKLEWQIEGRTTKVYPTTYQW